MIRPRNINNVDYIKKIEDYNKRIDGEVLEKKRTVEQAEQLKSPMRSIWISTTASIYCNFARRKVTIGLKVHCPFPLVESYFEDLNKKGKGSYVFDHNVIAGLVGANEGFEDSGFNKKAQRQGEFMYPGISKGYWGIREQYANGNLPVMYAAVTFDKYPNQTYMAFLGNKNQPVKKS